MSVVLIGKYEGLHVNDDTTAASGIPETDIIFDCEYCGKSLSIDPRGAGLMITCPDCGKRIQVPEGEGGEVGPAPADAAEQDATVAELSESLETSQAKVQELVQTLEEINTRRDYLEKVRVENFERFDRIARELSIIQSALDRIVTVLQDAGGNHNPPTAEE